MVNRENFYAIILCGGSGTRLWPLSRAQMPKHLLKFNDKFTLFQKTLLRTLKLISDSHISIVTNDNHFFEVNSQLDEICPKSSVKIICEPSPQNTLPAISLAMREVFKNDPSAIVSVFASDHAITNENIFLRACKDARSLAEEGFMVLLGAKPDEPATGYGYIKSGKLIPHNRNITSFEVDAFKEKPNKLIAEQYLKDGYLWNTGTFIFRADFFMKQLFSYQPEIYRLITSDMPKEKMYEFMPSLSIDYGLIESIKKIAVLPVDAGWGDLGNWESIYKNSSKDESGNFTTGKVIALDSKNNLLWSDSGILATAGVDNLIIVKTADATLVCDRKNTEDVKSIVKLMKDSFPGIAETHLTVKRPWGSYTVLEKGERFKVKRILVEPGQKLSLQKHKYRAEHWVVVSGEAEVICENSRVILIENQSTYIGQGQLHQLINPSLNNKLELIEIQSGSYLEEDDIERFDDKYGRI